MRPPRTRNLVCAYLNRTSQSLPATREKRERPKMERHSIGLTLSLTPGWNVMANGNASPARGCCSANDDKSVLQPQPQKIEAALGTITGTPYFAVQAARTPGADAAVCVQRGGPFRLNCKRARSPC